MQQLIVGSLVLLSVTLGWGSPGVAEQVPAPRGELRVVDTHPYNWAWISLNVFDHLVEFDKEGTLVPRLAAR
jgi:hypothetical protein